MIRGDKNDLIYLVVLLFLVAVYAHHPEPANIACLLCLLAAVYDSRYCSHYREDAVRSVLVTNVNPAYDSETGFSRAQFQCCQTLTPK